MPVVSEALRKHADKDPQIAVVLKRVMAGGLALSLNPQEVKQAERMVDTVGRPQIGLKIFLDQKKVRCVTCHKLEGIGGSTGPDLTKVWETHSIQKILEAMIEPSKEINEDYQTFLVETQQGRVYSGLKILDNDQEIVIRDAQGKDTRIPKNDVDLIEPSNKSIMPDNVVALLTYQEFMDLVAFLKSRETQELLRQRNHHWWVAGPYPNDFQTAYPPEARQDHTSPVANADGKPAAWRSTIVNSNGLLNLGGVFGGVENVSGYAMTYVHSPKEQEAVLSIGSGDPCRIWINGRLVHEFSGGRRTRPDQDKVKIQLKEGWNMVLAKVINRTGNHHFYLKILEAEDIRFNSEPQLSESKN